MDTFVWLSFIGTTLILTLTPGPSVLLASANSMKYGFQKTTGTILGDLSANLLQIALASAGLASIVVTSGEIFGLLKWLGVAYLIYMGIRKILEKPATEMDMTLNNNRTFLNLYTEGFLMSAANPKAILFFATLFPLFISESLPFLPQIIILAVTFLFLDGLCLMLYARFANKLKAYLEDQEKVSLQNKIVGSLLILSGLLLSTVKRANH